MSSVSRRLSLVVMITLLLPGACKRAAKDGAPAANPNAGVEAQKARMNRAVFAADGMCSDKLVRHYASQLESHRKIMATLTERLVDYKAKRSAALGHARYYPNVKLEKWAAERLQFSYGFWRDVYTPFNKLYGTFWCMRRDDMAILSSAELENGIDEIWATVKHLGPLPAEQNFELEK